MTVNPSKQTNSNDEFNVFEGYWNNYVNVHNSTNANASFDIDVGNNFSITKTTVDATWNYVNGKLSNGTSIGYTGGYKYNDTYFSAAQASDLNNAFSSIVTTIQQQSMSAPTRVETAHGEDFSGYVTYTDPIGEYMEVKGIHGILVNGNLYEGKSFAKHLQNWSSAPAEFKSALAEVLKKRCSVTGATMNVDAFIASAVASSNQAYYKSDTDFDNSLVWWGKSYLAAGEEDPHIQWIGAADNDTIEYLTNPTTKIPEGADYVCRSYYFYGTAGNADTIPNEDYLHFVVRVQRSLTAPYQETVVISTPASLLSVEKVLITEKVGNNNTKTYTASVNEVDLPVLYMR